MKKTILIFSVLLFFNKLFAQPCVTTNNLIINSGYDPITNTQLLPGVSDPKWIIDNANNIPGAVNNSAAIVTTHTSVSAANPLSNWIGFTNPSQYVTNNPTIGFYLITFRYSFKTCTDDNLTFNLNLANDNYISAIRIDGVTTSFSQPASLSNSNWQSFSLFNYTNNYIAGNHNIEVDVQNYDVTNAMNPHALNIYGSISSVTNSIVTATSPINCNCTTAPLQISVTPKSTLLCLGDSVQLVASGATTYSWAPNVGLNTTTGNTVWAKPTTTTIYTVTGTDNGNTATATAFVEVITEPYLVLSKSNDVSCDNSKIILSASGANDYSWTPANLCSNPASNTTSISIDKTTTFVVEGKVGNCKSIDSITVYYNGSGSDIFIPNAFSPNGDGKNDCWGVQAFGNYKSYFLTIYNRWGMPVFESTNPADCWNGNYRREKQNVDTYFYYLEAETECGNILRKGDITLIR